MRKFDPDSFTQFKKEKYIEDVNIDSPAVISVNMQLAAMAVNEFLSRIHGFREDESGNYAKVSIDILNGDVVNEDDGAPDEYLQKHVGRGDNVSSFLNMTDFFHRVQ